MDPRSMNLNAEMIFACRGNSDLTAAMKAENEKRKSLTVLLSPKGLPIDGRSIFFKLNKSHMLKFFMMEPVAPLIQDIL